MGFIQVMEDFFLGLTVSCVDLSIQVAFNYYMEVLAVRLCAPFPKDPSELSHARIASESHLLIWRTKNGLWSDEILSESEHPGASTWYRWRLGGTWRNASRTASTPSARGSTTSARTSTTWEAARGERATMTATGGGSPRFANQVSARLSSKSSFSSLIFSLFLRCNFTPNCLHSLSFLWTIISTFYLCDLFNGPLVQINEFK
jgi:hypothetical protein